MSEGHISEHPIGEDIPDWEHLKYHDVEIGDIGTWNLHIWKRIREHRAEYKCTVSPKRPFNWCNGYDTEYEAINNWMHVGDEYDGEQTGVGR